MDLGKLELTFVAHATFLIKTPSGKRIVVDPWFEGNPLCPPKFKQPPKVDAMFITHAHFDHIGDAVTLARKYNPKVVAIAETAMWLGGRKGIANVIGLNKGGTVEVEGVKATMTHAIHSCGISDGDEVVYGGEAASWVLQFENGIKVYHAGDTMVFGDMKIIGDLYRPDIALLPIGDHYTMDPYQAAYAIRLLGIKVVVPMHYGTFPVLTGTPEKLRSLTGDIAGLEIVDLRPGETLTGNLNRLVAV